jgi:hypothetical protein
MIIIHKSFIVTFQNFAPALIPTHFLQKPVVSKRYISFSEGWNKFQINRQTNYCFHPTLDSRNSLMLKKIRSILRRHYNLVMPGINNSSLLYWLWVRNCKILYVKILRRITISLLLFQFEHFFIDFSSKMLNVESTFSLPTLIFLPLL